MRLRIAKKILRVADVLLEKALRGRARLALFIEIKTQPTKSAMVRRMAKELGISIIDLKFSETDPGDLIPIFAEDRPLPIQKDGVVEAKED